MSLSPLSAPLTCVVLAAVPRAQLRENQVPLPGGEGANDSTSEQVDFADVDLDGDWDAVFADGGDQGNDQNRAWINLGGLQRGQVGTFADATAERLPAVQDTSRDVEFGDVDGDGDPDLYVANTSTFSNQPCRFWINGGAADGELGFYVDETAARWVGLGGAGSSIAASLVLPGGGFIDWASDGEFGDLDNDGDLDLFQASVDQSHVGDCPSRIFLNDGDGYFSEFNPSGFQLSGADIFNGEPALWAEGEQFNGTTDTTGLQADIANVSVDADLADLDGDLDLDALQGDRPGRPRVFDNRLEGGALIFRDVSHAVLPADWALGGGNYEQELGDLDNDGDVDLYGLNWDPGTFASPYVDRVFHNQGDGTFGAPAQVPDSGPDDEEVDFLDYDADGDLDVYVANFSGTNRLYRNDEGTLLLQQPNSSGTSRDADAADVDADGDYDVMVANSGFQPNVFMENVTDVPDTTAPVLLRLEDPGDRSAAPGVLPVRVQVYDNAPYYVTWYNFTELKLAVDAIVIGPIPMRSSGGQIFRTEIPANLVGEVSYRVRSLDEYLNTGISKTVEFTGTGATGSSFGTGSAGSLGVPSVKLLSSPFAGSPLYVAGGEVPPATNVLVAFSTAALSEPVDLGSGVVLNLGVPLALTLGATAQVDGHGVFEVLVPPGIGGAAVFLQVFAEDGVGGDVWASSEGFSTVIQ